MRSSKQKLLVVFGPSGCAHIKRSARGSFEINRIDYVEDVGSPRAITLQRHSCSHLADQDDETGEQEAQCSQSSGKGSARGQVAPRFYLEEENEHR